jgi:hypothetical protein
VNFNWLAGGHVALEATYADGANNYLGLGNVSESFFLVNFPFDTDEGHGWSITGEAGFNITPALTTVIFGSYIDFSGADFNGTLPTAAIPPFIAARPGTVPFEQPDFKAYVIGANATYTVVKGLTVAAEVYYENQDFDDTRVFSGVLDALGNPILNRVRGFNNDEIAGGLRIKRVF